jgi:hypothetical protein
LLLKRLQVDGSNVDPHIKFEGRLKRRLLVNIDYAFGKQAEDIIGALILIFGKNIRSVNVLGKAGAFQGKRGDLILATSLVSQRTGRGVLSKLTCLARVGGLH